jgi:hypothetical protein
MAVIAPDVTAWLESLSEDKVRGEVLVAVHAAAARTGLADPSVTKALGVDGREPDFDLRTEVDALAGRLDEEAWSIQESEGDTARYLAAFKKARAASAVVFWLDQDARSSADDVLYEVQAALGSVDSLRALLAL